MGQTPSTSSSTTPAMSQVAGHHRLRLSQSMEASQILVKLSKTTPGSDTTYWLSPVGWSLDEKGTLLDCVQKDGGTELEIPSEFARDIAVGDRVKLHSPELALTHTLSWAEVTLQPEDVALKSETAEAGKGLLSRFARKTVAPVPSNASETEIRAAEAKRMAENYKAKMDAASAAKEEAQRKALAAAKEAEAALQMEMARIAEMEHAARAFEEAEKLQQDEMRRVAEEQRIEAERQAEEQRRIEAARARELAARKAAERAAAIKRYQAAIDVTENEKQTLALRLDTLLTDANVAREATAQREASVEKIHETEAKLSDLAEKKAAVLDKAKANLNAAETELDLATRRATDVKAQHETLDTRLFSAETAYHDAQRAAEAAIAMAAMKKEAWEDLKLEKTDIEAALARTGSAFDDQLAAKQAQYAITQRHEAEFENVSLKLSSTREQLETLRLEAKQADETAQSLEIQIEATRQAIEDLSNRAADHRTSVSKLMAGEDPSTLAEISELTAGESDALTGGPSMKLKLRSPSALAQPTATKVFPIDDTPSLHTRFGEKIAGFSLPKISPKLSAPDMKMPHITMPDIDLPKVSQKQGVGLLAIAVVIGAGSIMAYSASNRPASITLAATEKAAPMDVASAVAKAAPIAPVVEAPASVIETSAALANEIAPEAAEVKTADIESDIKTATAEIPKPEKTAELIVPRPKISVAKPIAPSPKIDASTPKAKAAPAPEITPEVVIIETPQVEAKVANNEVANNEEADAPTNYPELTSDVQTRLATLGMYSGDINGEQTPDTLAAIREFKTLFGLEERYRDFGRVFA
ncbi:hypothetical protein AB8615_09140 [Litorimonas sp. RW-G-Af-16]|uniref:hypothetical protein n=1 Tax=Litorimonas sp. RW-G-Af-16 TaxID=3241168 RepID=UPI003AAD6970